MKVFYLKLNEERLGVLAKEALSKFDDSYVQNHFKSALAESKRLAGETLLDKGEYELIEGESVTLYHPQICFKSKGGEDVFAISDFHPTRQEECYEKILFEKFNPLLGEIPEDAIEIGLELEDFINAMRSVDISKKLGLKPVRRKRRGE